MTNEGWVKIHRKITEWEWWEDDQVFKLFMYLILKANHKDTRFRGHEIKRGEVVIGFKSLSKALGFSLQTTRTNLERLKSTRSLTCKSTHRFTIVTICNYDTYQSFTEADQHANQHENQHATNTQLTRNQHATNTIQELKNLRMKEGEELKEKKLTQKNFCVESFEFFWDLYAKKVDRSVAYRKWAKVKPDEYERIFEHVRRYVDSTPDVQFRKNPSTYLNQKHWQNEIIGNLSEEDKIRLHNENLIKKEMERFDNDQ